MWSAGLQWIFDNRNTYNIKVVNVSLNSSVAESSATHQPIGRGAGNLVGERHRCGGLGRQHRRYL